MPNQFSRTELLIGKDAVEKLKSARVVVFGVGGVGGYAAEALARSGVGHIDIVDNDTVSLTNINRQIIALHSTVGQYKVDVMKRRMQDINPDIDVNAYNVFFCEETADGFDLSQYDYIVDAIDSVKSKILLIERANENAVKIISAMGAGNKLDASAFEVSDISKTSVCPLARVMRYELKKKGIKRLKVVYSKEQPIAPAKSDEDVPGKRQVPGSMAYVTASAGLLLAGEVIKDLIK
ncbi:MAG: ThiF family adenylyltransferase [Eubacterium sp.]